MGELRHDSFSRGPGRAGEPKVASRSRSASLSLVLSILAALVLLALGRVDHRWLAAVRGELTAALEPALKVARLPIEGARAIADRPESDSGLLKELADLRRENREVGRLQARADALEAEVKELRRLVGRVDDRQVAAVTARVYLEGVNAFASSAVIDVGSRDGIKTGFAVVDGDGLVGTVVEASERSARLLLLRDRRSRIPVFVGKRRVRGILLGRGEAAPELELARSSEAVEAGAPVTTSGEDGILPRGLAIGTAEPGGGTWAVRTNAALDRLDYVTVLIFEAPGSDLASELSGGAPP